MVLLLISLNCFAQSEQSDMIIRDELDENTNYTLEQLDWLMFQKVNLEEFLSTPELYSIYINHTQYLNLLTYYNDQGELLDLLELQNIAGFDYADYIKLSKIIQCDYKVKTKSSRQLQYKRRIKFSESSEKEQLLFNYYEQERIAVNLNNTIKFAWNKERDFKENEYYHSAFMHYQHKNFEIGIGNYEIFIGQGLLFGQSFLNSSILGFTGISSNTRSFKSVANNNEINSMQGMYASFYKNNNQLHVASNNNNHHLIAFEHRNKNNKFSIVVSKQKNERLASGYYYERRFRNIVGYTEIAIDNGLAYSLGGILLLSNAQQFTLSKTYFSSGFTSDFSAPLVFGIKKQNESGYRIAYSHAINYINLIELRCIYRTRSGITELDEMMGQKMKYDIAVHKNFKIKKYSFQYSYIDNINHRYRIRIHHIFNENWQARYQILSANQYKKWSIANSISIQYKFKRWTLSNLLCFGKIEDKVPIYYNEQSASGRVTNNLFDGGRFNDISISTRIYKYFYIRGNLQHYIKYIDKSINKRIFIQFEIKC